MTVEMNGKNVTHIVFQAATVQHDVFELLMHFKGVESMIQLLPSHVQEQILMPRLPRWVDELDRLSNEVRSLSVKTQDLIGKMQRAIERSQQRKETQE